MGSSLSISKIGSEERSKDVVIDLAMRLSYGAGDVPRAVTFRLDTSERSSSACCVLCVGMVR